MPTLEEDVEKAIEPLMSLCREGTYAERKEAIKVLYILSFGIPIEGFSERLAKLSEEAILESQ